MRKRATVIRSKRLIWLDAARTIALGAMIFFHFFRDLELFGYLDAGTTSEGGWAVFARLTAGTFVFLSGISLVLAHNTGFRFMAWVRRFLRIVAAAALVSAATYLAFPGQFIYFGILHLIAVASVLGIVLLRAPGLVLLLLALTIAYIQSIPHDAFSTPWLAWTGLSKSVPPSLDHLPLVPWLAAFLFGMAAVKLLPIAHYDFDRASGTWATICTWPGQHSLSVYLLHQPVLLGCLWLISRAM